MTAGTDRSYRYMPEPVRPFSAAEVSEAREARTDTAPPPRPTHAPRANPQQGVER